jgi:glycosyltransferase involved in cell wall biosynthesis
VARPSVSVLIPNYNYGRYLERALGSVAAQTHDDFEVVVVDDCSTDDSATVLRETLPQLGHPFTLEVNEVNRGFGWTLARALSLSSGEHIALLDPDDFFMPEKLAAQVEVMRGDDDVVVVYSDTVQTTAWPSDRPWEVDPDELRALGRVRPDGPLPANATKHLFRRGTSFAPQSSLVRRTALDSIGGYRSDLRTTVDYRNWLHLSTTGSFRYLPGLVGGSTIHAESMRATQGTQKRLDRMRILEEFATVHGRSGDLRFRARRNLRGMQIRKEPARRREAWKYVRWSKDPVGLYFVLR